MLNILFKIENSILCLTSNGEVYNSDGDLMFYREHIDAWFPIGLDEEQLTMWDKYSDNELSDLFEELWMLTKKEKSPSFDCNLVLNGQDFVMGEGNLATQKINQYNFRKKNQVPIQFRISTKKGWMLDYGEASFVFPKTYNHQIGYSEQRRMVQKEFDKHKIEPTNGARSWIERALEYPTAMNDALAINRIRQMQSYFRRQDRVTFKRGENVYTMLSNGIVYNNDKGQYELFAFQIGKKYHAYDRNGVAVPIKSKIDKLFLEVYGDCFGR